MRNVYKVVVQSEYSGKDYLVVHDIISKSKDKAEAKAISELVMEIKRDHPDADLFRINVMSMLCMTNIIVG